MRLVPGMRQVLELAHQLELLLRLFDPKFPVWFLAVFENFVFSRFLILFCCFVGRDVDLRIAK